MLNARRTMFARQQKHIIYLFIIKIVHEVQQEKLKYTKKLK